MAKEKKRLKLDLESLFLGDSFTIGETNINISPFGIKQLATIARKLKAFGATLAEQGVTWDNYNTPENLLQLSILALEEFPDILEEATNVDIEDLQELPIDIIVELVDKVLEVNMKAKEKLEGNFKSLAEKLNLTKVTNPKLVKRSKS